MDQDEAPAIPVRCLVIVLFGVGGRQPKMDSSSIRQPERVVTQVFTSLDVVLIVVRPVELHLFAFVRNRVNAFLVPAKRQKIPLVVVPPEEVEQIREDLVLQGGYVYRLR